QAGDRRRGHGGGEVLGRPAPQEVPLLGRAHLDLRQDGQEPLALAAPDRRRQAAAGGFGHLPVGAIRWEASTRSASLRLAAPESRFSLAIRRPSSGLLAAPAT